MKKPKISIIVPVYKVEKYIDKCIKSLINQTYTNIEILLINDGSPDKCPEICESYAEKDSRIKVIHKKNGGLSEARNVGIYKAQGDYILFVDSDDYIDLDSCERFIKIIGSNRPDIVVGNAMKIEGKIISKMIHSTNTAGIMIPGSQYLKNELEFNTMYMAAWLNLYRREFLINNNLEFKVGLFHEDEHFTPRAFLRAKKVIGTDIVFYNYIIRSGSITKNKDFSKNAIHIIKICKELAEIYKTVDDIRLKKLLYDSLASKYLYAFQMGALYRKEFKNLLDKKFVYSMANRKKTKIKAGLFLFSSHLYYWLNHFVKKLKLRSILNNASK